MTSHFRHDFNQLLFAAVGNQICHHMEDLPKFTLNEQETVDHHTRRLLLHSLHIFLSHCLTKSKSWRQLSVQVNSQLHLTWKLITFFYHLQLHVECSMRRFLFFNFILILVRVQILNSLMLLLVLICQTLPL